MLREHVIGWGDLDAAGAAADVVVEHTYRFPMVTHFAIEPHAFMAAPDGDGIAVWTLDPASLLAAAPPRRAS